MIATPPTLFRNERRDFADESPLWLDIGAPFSGWKFQVNPIPYRKSSRARPDRLPTHQSLCAAVSLC